MSKLLILGAGVEKTEGIDMPLANELVPQIRDFLYTDELGIQIDKKLREIIKGLRFSYDDFVKKAVDKLAKDFRKEVNQILASVRETIDNDFLTENQKKIGQIIISFFEKIQKLQDNVILDEETANLIREVFSDITVDDENIVDLGKLTFSDTFEVVMRKILEISISEPNHPILKHVYKNLMDFENLLLKHFIGFYNESESDIKKYLYISWTLWAYLVWKEKKVYIDSQEKTPFYSEIKNVDEVITFNYTSFANKYFRNPQYFHGSLSKYIRLDNRGEFQIDDYYNLNILNFLDQIVKVNIDFDNKKYVIPSLVPPLKLKPVLSNEYIDIWHQSVEKIRLSEKIVVVGYSFSYADEHFNDLIRKNKDKKIYIIDPYADNIIKNIQRIFNNRPEDYTISSIQNQQAFVSGNVTVIKSTASLLNIDQIFALS